MNKQIIIAKIKCITYGKQNRLNKYVLVGAYSVIWLILAVVLYLIFKINGRSFLWLPDGKYEHYIAFDYLCKYVEQLIRGEGFKPFYNYTIGQGQDILSALVGYDFTDLVCLIVSLIYPVSEIARYTLMIFIKLYLAGLSFIIFCYVMEKKDAIAILSGAISYTFSGVVLYSIIRHPNFASWFYFFPLMLAAIEIYFRREKKTPLILVVFLNLVANYYVFYINTILSAIYVIIRIAFDNNPFERIRKSAVMIGIGAVGVCLSSFCTFPVIYSFTQQVRVGQDIGYTDSLLFYPLSYYQKLITSMFSSFSGAGYYTHIGFNVSIIIGLFFLLSRKNNGVWKTLIGLYFLMLCIPMCGKIMNGFSYPCNRWSYAFVFIASYILVETFHDIQEATCNDVLLMILFTVTYIALSLYCQIDYDNKIEYFPIVMIIWSVTAFVVLNRVFPSTIPWVILLICFVSSASGIYVMFAKDKADYVSEHEKKSNVSFETSAIAIPADDTFYRVEISELESNASNINHINGTTSYWAIMPDKYLDFYSGLSLDTLTDNCKIDGLDGRTGLLSLASIKYYTCKDNEKGNMPYGYKEIASSRKGYSVFSNPHALPIGYTYNKYITTEEYNKLNGLGKEQALLSGAVLDKRIEGVKSEPPSISYNKLDYIVTDFDGIEWKNNQICVRKKAGKISLEVDKPRDSELYLYFRNVEVKGKDRANVVINRKGEEKISKKTRLIGKKYNWYYDQKDVAINLGSTGAGSNVIDIVFDRKCNISCDSMELIAVPMAKMEERIKELSKYVLEDIIVKDDYVSGNIDLPEKRILQLSIPYSKGWRAIVDGKEQELLPSDIMYMALPLSAGKHNIQLYYQTPYLKEGVIVSLCTLCLCLVYGLFEVIMKMKKGESENG